jgi:hypothetical protein
VAVAEEDLETSIIIKTSIMASWRIMASPINKATPIQSGRGHTGGRRVILPALTINEGGRGRSTTTRAARNVSRGRGGRGGIGRGKEILVDPEPEENE